jgi:hypothetical protein
LALASRDSVGGNLPPFFNPGDFTDAIAIIFEPKKVQHGVPGKWGPRTHVTAVLSVFKKEPQLEEGRPTVVTLTINTKSIADELDEQFKGDPNAAIIAVVKPYKPKNGGRDTFVLRQPADGYYDAAADYYANREKALAKAIDEAPDFD